MLRIKFKSRLVLPFGSRIKKGEVEIALSVLIILLPKIYVVIYANDLFVIILQIGSLTETILQKILVSNFWYVNESVINKFTDCFIGGKYKLKKITCFIPSVKLHVTDRMHRSVIPSVS